MVIMFQISNEVYVINRIKPNKIYELYQTFVNDPHSTYIDFGRWILLIIHQKSIRHFFFFLYYII